jgi:hypothetical protein
VATFPEPLVGTSRYYGLIRPYATASIRAALPACWRVFGILSWHRRVGSSRLQRDRLCSLDEPLGIALAALTPETEAADGLVIAALIPCDRPTQDSLSRKGYFRHVIGRFTFVQRLCSLLTDFRHGWLSAF